MMLIIIFYSFLHLILILLLLHINIIIFQFIFYLEIHYLFTLIYSLNNMDFLLNLLIILSILIYILYTSLVKKSSYLSNSLKSLHILI